MPIRIAAYGLLFVACASAGDVPVPATDAPATRDGSSPSGPSMCPTGEVATARNSTGQVTCASPEAATRAAIGTGCSVYLGWRDSCDGCTLPPTKWGRAGATCANVGADNTCTTPTLGGTAVPMLGLNFDGDVDGNDKLYAGLHCAPPPPATSTAAPCVDGGFVSGANATGWICTSLGDAAAAYVRDNCALYLGWRDSCDGCVTAPAKWGFAGDASCQNGLGIDNTCSTATLGGEAVRLFGLNPDGDVNDDDKFYVGLHCTAPAPASSTTALACPAGQFVIGTSTDGTLLCESPAPYFYEYFTQRCSLYVGWRDSCNGCLTPPSKWGSVAVGACSLGVGANDTCGTFSLGQSIHMFGLNTDGDVGADDVLYVGLHCI